MLDIAVIGAGLTGLAAADALGSLGRSCVVLEARRESGGRVRQVRGMDAGAEFVHGRSAVIGQLLRDIDADPSRLSSKGAGRLRIYRRTPDARNFSTFFSETVEALVGRVQDCNDEGRSVESLLSETSSGLAVWFARERVERIEGSVASDIDAARVSLADQDGRGGRYNYVLPISTYQLVSHLSRDVEVWHEAEVYRVVEEAAAVRIVLRDGRVLGANQCIVCLPHNLIRLGYPRIDLAPAQLRDLHRAASQFVSSPLRKLVCDLPPSITPPATYMHSTGIASTWWFRESEVSSRFVSLLAGSAYWRANLLPKSEVHATALVELGAWLRLDLNRLKARIYDFDWGREPFAQGAYPSYAVGSGVVRTALGSRRVRFAGDWLADDGVGTMEAAVQSGRTAAHRAMADL